MTDEVKNDDDRKLFVGGLPQEAKDTDIKEYFSTFGEIENVNLKTDPNTGRSRGFAFVVFEDADALTAATKQDAHVVKVGKLETYSNYWDKSRTSHQLYHV